MENKILGISEIFYSLQGEGARAGTPTFFIRTQGCSAKHACYASGIRCDTDFMSGSEMSLGQIYDTIKKLSKDCMEITWTGGEPLDQLTPEILNFFKEKGYFQAVETSGLKQGLAEFDFICVSPKVAEHVVKKNFPNGVNELRYVRHSGQFIPQPEIEAQHYWISPHSDGFNINVENLKYCINLCKEHPKWKLSVQQHKIWNVL